MKKSVMMRCPGIKSNMEMCNDCGAVKPHRHQAVCDCKDTTCTKCIPVTHKPKKPSDKEMLDIATRALRSIKRCSIPGLPSVEYVIAEKALSAMKASKK